VNSTCIYYRNTEQEEVEDDGASNENDPAVEKKPSCVKSTEPRSYDLTDLIPGALYNVTVKTVSRLYNDADPTVNWVSLLYRVKPNPPEQAKADSTRGTIHLSWHRPQGMSRVSGWKYRLRYVLSDVGPEDPDQPEEMVKFIPAGTSSDSKSSIPRRDDFLSRLLSGRKYMIHIESISGNGNDTVVSNPLGPLYVYTQPEQPTVIEWLQVTTDHIKIIWAPPENPEGKFNNYYLNVTRRRARRQEANYGAESYHFKFDKNETSHIMKITTGALYNLTLTTIVGLEKGQKMLESIVTNENKILELETWSPYVMHSPFKRLEWKFSSCGKIGRFGPSQV
jgi:hypothetical protein